MSSMLVETSLERLPPHSVESEMCFIASMMLTVDRHKLRELRQALREDDFYQADHQIMFRVIAEFVDRDKPVDAMVFREELLRRQLLDEVGGTEYLAQILNAVPNAANGLYYAADVRRAATLRRSIDIATDLLRECYNPQTMDDAPEEMCRRYCDRLSGIASSGTDDTTIRLGDAAVAVLERRDDPVLRRIPTGIVSLDAVIGGLPLTKFTMIGADPRVGKSALAKQILKNVSKMGIRGGLVTIEEDREKVAENMLANESGVPNYQIAHGNMSREHWDSVEGAAVELAKLDYFIDDRPSKLSQVIASIERMAVKHRCQVIVVDHIHLIEYDGGGDGRSKWTSREQEVSKSSKALKAAFKRLNVAGVVCAQLNREKDNKQKPTLRNLRDSGNLEADGDVIMLLYRQDVIDYKEPGYVPTHTMEVNIAKNKDGRMAEIPVRFIAETQAISDMPQQEDPFA